MQAYIAILIIAAAVGYLVYQGYQKFFAKKKQGCDKCK